MIKNLLAFASVVVAIDRTSFNDVEKSIGEIITQHGYTFEEHSTQTSDGYDLTLHRIKGSGKPVMIMHGSEGSSVYWVVNEKDKTPAFKLAAEGYDVWLGNIRGSYYSQTHKTLKISDSAFWHFNQDDIATIDVPAHIEKVLSVNGASKLAAYIGYSNGGNTFFEGAALMADYFESKV
jgi:lysosomal acid lipase/cholesteryl ester hydrolase